MLAVRPTCCDHLAAIVEASQELTDVTLATLNHDLVLETALDADQLAYSDGFERTEEDVRRWEDNWGGSRVRILKLHGSIAWWDYTFADESWRGWVTCRYHGNDALTRGGLVSISRAIYAPSS